jgi:chloramphenicol 3-O-phosphotransferase
MVVRVGGVHTGVEVLQRDRDVRDREPGALDGRARLEQRERRARLEGNLDIDVVPGEPSVIGCYLQV